MYIHKKSSSHIGPGWTVTVGIMLLVIAGALMYVVVDGLVTGEVIKLSRLDPGVITRDDNPSEFWMSEMFFSYFILLLVILAVRSFVRARKLSRKH
jgi:hypothetical protein